MFKLLHLGWELIPEPEWGLYPSLAENHSQLQTTLLQTGGHQMMIVCKKQ